MLLRLKRESGSDALLWRDLPQFPLQRPPPAVQPRADRADRTIQNLGDLLVSELLHEIESTDRPELLGKGPNSGRHLFGVELAEDQCRRVRGTRVQPRRDRVGVKIKIGR